MLCGLLCERGQTSTTSKKLHEIFDRFQIWSNITQHACCNILQHIATGWPNACNMFCPTMFAQQFCPRCCAEMLLAFGQALSPAGTRPRYVQWWLNQRWFKSLTRVLNFQLTKTLDSEDGSRTGCQNVSHQQQSFSGLQSLRWSISIKM